MTALLTKVKATMTIHAHRKMRGLLDGEYASIYHGHSMDFDDLREYVVGDEIRDIDWKATARHTTALVKRYVAHRRHALGIIVDSGRNFDAIAAGGESKRELAILLAGMTGYLAVRHGDDVMLMHGDAGQTAPSRLKGTEAHLEQLLRGIQAAGGRGRASDVRTQLTWAAEHLRRRMMLLVIADDVALTDADLPLLRRLSAQHEMMWLTVSDAHLTGFGRGTTPFDISDDRQLPIPHELLGGRELAEQYAHAEAERKHRAEGFLRSAGIAHVRVDDSRTALRQLRRLMRKQHALRR